TSRDYASDRSRQSLGDSQREVSVQSLRIAPLEGHEETSELVSARRIPNDSGRSTGVAGHGSCGPGDPGRWGALGCHRKEDDQGSLSFGDATSCRFWGELAGNRGSKSPPGGSPVSLWPVLCSA